MNKFFAIFISILIHSILFVELSESYKLEDFTSSKQVTPMKVYIKKQVVNSNKSKNSKLKKDKKYFLGKQDNSFKKNKTTKMKGKFKEGKKLDLKAFGKGLLEIAQSPDYTPDAEISNVVEFNTIRYRYYSFFKRIQDRLTNTWRPLDYRFKNKNLITEVTVTINKKGEIINIRTSERSGDYSFDLISREAFIKAMPFVNPPKGLIASGKFSFEWKFILN